MPKRKGDPPSEAGAEDDSVPAQPATKRNKVDYSNFPLEKAASTKERVLADGYTVANFKSLASIYKEAVDQFEDSGSPLAQWRKEKIDETSADTAIKQKISIWKKETTLVFHSCISDLTKLLNEITDPQLKKDAEAVKEEFETLIKRTQGKALADVEDIMRSLNMHLKRGEPSKGADADEKIAHRESSARSRYRKEYKSYKPILEAALSNDHTSEKVKNQILQLHSDYEKLNEDKIRRHRAIPRRGEGKRSRVIGEGVSQAITSDEGDIGIPTKASDELEVGNTFDMEDYILWPDDETQLDA